MEIKKWIFRKIMINKVYISRKKMRKRREKAQISALPSQKVDIKERKFLVMQKIFCEEKIKMQTTKLKSDNKREY